MSIVKFYTKILIDLGNLLLCVFHGTLDTAKSLRTNRKESVIISKEKAVLFLKFSLS